MIKYFLPESNDLVDPSYDFINDSYSPQRNSMDLQVHDVYPHEIFSNPPFDGLLVSKSNINSDLEKKISLMGGIHNYLRLPKQYSVMGDCGAFQFIGETIPPYSPKEILEYYEKLHFDYGITLDHVIVQFDQKYDKSSLFSETQPTDDMKKRFRISIDNAIEMLSLQKKTKSTVKLIGAVQGWSPKSYHEGIKELIAEGFDYIAIGGIAKENNKKKIRLLLSEIKDTVVNNGVKLHILGKAPLDFVDDFKQVNVASCDSASSLMQGLKGGKFFLGNEKYSLIRIPKVMGSHPSPLVRKHMKSLRENGDINLINKEEYRLHSLEIKALKGIRAYAGNKGVTLSETLEALIKFGDEFPGLSKFYDEMKRTLEDRPWEKCACEICKQIGVEVVILRSNNHNRRRGFHNTWDFYNEFRKLIS